MIRVAVAGTGYVDLSNAVLLAQFHEVVALDIDAAKVALLNLKYSPIADREVEDFLAHKPLNLRATLDNLDAYAEADFVAIATPTDYDTQTNTFNSCSVESVVRELMTINPQAVMVIKSTVPVGFTGRLKHELGTEQLLFSPLFLLECKALHDNLYLSRIMVGERSARGQMFAELLCQGSLHPDVPVLLTDNTDAEAIKLCEHLPCIAGGVLQRAGQLCRHAWVGHTADHRRCVPGPPHWKSLQQPELWLWRLRRTTVTYRRT